MKKPTDITSKLPKGLEIKSKYNWEKQRLEIPKFKIGTHSFTRFDTYRGNGAYGGDSDSATD